MDMKRTGRPLGPHHIGDALLAVDGVAIRVRQERCAKVRNRNVACLRCADACTSGCISFGDGELRVAPERCVGCGTCATVCPTCALEAVNPTDAALAAACLATRRPMGEDAPRDEVCVVCSQVEAALGDLLDPAAYAGVVCAGRVDESLVCRLAAEGAGRVTVVCGRCDRCAQRHGRDTAELVAATARVLLEAWGGDCEVVVAGEVPATALRGGADEAAEAARRLEAFFAVERACAPIRLAGDAGVRADEAVGCADVAPGGDRPAGMAERDDDHGPGMRFYWGSTHTRRVGRSMHVMKDGTLPHFVPDRRERLLDALAALGEPQRDQVDCRLWGTIVIDATRCTSCRMCSTFCPTGAIRRFDDEDGAMGVEHLPGDCVKCGSCRDICPADAISLLDGVRTSYLMDGGRHRYVMTPRAVSLTDNPHQILDTMRQSFNGDIFER